MVALKRLIAFLILAFLLLLLARFVAGYFYEFDRASWAAGKEAVGRAWSFASIEYEMAVFNNQEMIKDVPLAQQISRIEVFAKEAGLTATTRQFDESESKARQAIENHKGLIRIERMNGLKPNRSLQFVIRVPVEQFEGLVEALQAVGKLESFNVTKEDRSSQARQLMIEKKSLADYKQSLAALREAKGEVAALINLEEKIQQVQRQIEQLDGNLAGMVGEKSYHNISFDLAEEIPFFVDEEAYPLGARVADAVVWTVQWYMLGVFGLFALILVGWSVATLFGNSGSDEVTK